MTSTSTAADAPTYVSKIGLRARDASRLAEYYGLLLGLEAKSRTASTISLGVADDMAPILEIEHVPELEPDDPASAGLFHTAFLLPSRADLARWVKHASTSGLRIDGASDHLVSEAIYLNDPEGNGIEIYADRAREHWKRDENRIAMATNPLDFDDLMSMAAEPAQWRGAPAGTMVGHVHLRVGDPVEAERWWADELGFETMAKYGRAAVFLATGGYHHHIGANSWRSAGAGKRDANRAGLGWVELRSRDTARQGVHIDPWGTEIRVVQA
jgi:catechol 2,3-dioxygenase